MTVPYDRSLIEHQGRVMYIQFNYNNDILLFALGVIKAINYACKAFHAFSEMSVAFL